MVFAQQKDLVTGDAVRPFIITYGTRGEQGEFREKVRYTLEGSPSDTPETPEVSALKYMGYWQTTYMSLDQAFSGVRSLEEKTAFIHYFLIASSQDNPVVTVEERNRLFLILIEQCSADDIFEIGAKLRSHQPLFSLTLLDALSHSLEGASVVPEKIRDIFGKLSSLNDKSKDTLFPRNRYYIPPVDVDRPAPYRTFLGWCHQRNFNRSFFVSSSN